MCGEQSFVTDMQICLTLKNCWASFPNLPIRSSHLRSFQPLSELFSMMEGSMSLVIHRNPLPLIASKLEAFLFTRDSLMGTAEILTTLSFPNMEKPELLYNCPQKYSTGQCNLSPFKSFLIGNWRRLKRAYGSKKL